MAAELLVHLSWVDIERAADACAQRNDGQGIRSCWGVPRGGLIPAVMVAQRMGLRLVEEPDDRCLIVDDLIDSGATAMRVALQYQADAPRFDALFRKSHSPPIQPSGEWWPVTRDGWLVFPWERAVNEQPAEDGVVRLLEAIGEDPTREGLRDTPGRVVRALREMTAGTADDPAEILSTTFDGEDYDSMVVLRNIEFTSLCEHHLLPFTGVADVGYISSGRVVGLSKLARLVECYARRPQLQERMTQQIAAALETHLDPKGVGVIVRAHHSCMGCRGVRKPSAEMVTSTLLGYMRVSAEARAEFMRLAEG